MAQATRKWSAKVQTDSTHPPQELFTKASKDDRTNAPGSGMRMLTFFINRAGKNLTPARRAALEKAKELLSMKVKVARARKKKAA